MSDRSRLLCIVTTRIAICVFAVSQTMLSPLVTKIGADFQQGLGGSGLLFTAYYISNIFFCLVTGKIISLLGKERSMKGSLLLYAASAFAFSCCRSYPAACVCFSMMGALAVFLESAGMDIIDDLSADSASSNLTMTHGIAGIGMVAGVLFAGLLLTAGFGWRAIYRILATGVTIAGLLYLLVRFPRLHPPTSGGLSELKGWFITTPSTYILYLALFLYVGTENIITGWMSTYMSDYLHFDILRSACGTAVIWLFVTIGRITSAVLVKRISMWKIIAFLNLTVIAGLLCVLAGPVRLFWPAMAVIGLGLSGIWPLTAALLLQRESNGGTAMSVTLMFGYFGAAVLPFIAGLIGGHFGIRAAILSGVGFLCVLGLVLFRVHRDYP